MRKCVHQRRSWSPPGHIDKHMSPGLMAVLFQALSKTQAALAHWVLGGSGSRLCRQMHHALLTSQRPIMIPLPKALA